MEDSERQLDLNSSCTGGRATGATRGAACWCRWVALVALVVLVGLGIKYGRYHVFAKRFAEVEGGQVYRAGMVKPGPLERLIREHQIKTILTLMKFEEDDPDQVAEKTLAEREGIAVLRIPMPGDGCADFDLLEQAAAAVAGESHRPILVHCAAGVQRTGATLAVWRMKYHGWSPERALAEMREHGYDEHDNPALREHLKAFYRERLAPSPESRESG